MDCVYEGPTPCPNLGQLKGHLSHRIPVRSAEASWGAVSQLSTSLSQLLLPLLPQVLIGRASSNKPPECSPLSPPGELACSQT